MQNNAPIGTDCERSPVFPRSSTGEQEIRQGRRFLVEGTTDQIKGQSVRGGLVSVIAQGLRTVLQTGATVILARLLTPADYGLQGMAVAVVGFLGLFRDAGLNLATIQREALTQEQISTAFWINAGLGGVLSLMSMACAPLMVVFYREPRLFWVTLVLGMSFAVCGLGIQHRALLQRNMRFMTLAKIDLTSLAVSSAAGITMASFGFGYWSLVGMAMAEPITSAAGAWLAVRWVPGWPRRGTGVRSLLRFGGTVTLTNLLLYVGNNAEKVLIGRFCGAEALGLYGRAYSLVSLVTNQLHSAIFSVAFPALARLQSDPKRLISSFLKGYSVVLSLTVPATVCCILFAEELIRLLLGTKWLAAAPILSLLAPSTLALGLCSPLGWFLTATGRAGRSCKFCLVAVPVLLLGIVAGLPYGPKGVALTYSVAWTIVLIPAIAWSIHGTGIFPADCWKAAKPAIVSGLVTAGCSLVFESVAKGLLSPALRLMLGVSIAGMVYSWMLLVVMRQKALFTDLLRQLYRRKSAKEPELANAVATASRRDEAGGQPEVRGGMVGR